MLSVKTLLTALAAAALLAAQAQTPAQQIAAHVRPNDLKADVSFLASDALQGRATPSPGLDMAAEYIAAQFRREIETQAEIRVSADALEGRNAFLEKRAARFSGR